MSDESGPLRPCSMDGPYLENTAANRRADPSFCSHVLPSRGRVYTATIARCKQRARALSRFD